MHAASASGLITVHAHACHICKWAGLRLMSQTFHVSVLSGVIIRVKPSSNAVSVCDFTLFILHLKHETWCVDDYNPEEIVTQKLSLAGSICERESHFCVEWKSLHQFFQCPLFQNNASGFDSQAPLRNSEMFSGGWTKCNPLDICWRSRGIVRSNVWSELSTFVSDQFLGQSLLGFKAHHRFKALRSVFVQKKSFFF